MREDPRPGWAPDGPGRSLTTTGLATVGVGGAFGLSGVIVGVGTLVFGGGAAVPGFVAAGIGAGLVAAGFVLLHVDAARQHRYAQRLYDAWQREQRPGGPE